MQDFSFKLIKRLLVLIGICLSSGFAMRPEVIQAKVDSLLGEMTLKEKVGQLVQRHWDGEKNIFKIVKERNIGSVLNAPRDPETVNRLQKTAVEETRLKIPLLIGFDVIHGLRTIMPIPLGEAASWDPVLAEKSAAIGAAEAAAVGINWTFAPMVDIARDARWGRIAEGAGEDPYLGSVMAVARVRGFQGEDMSAPDRIMACAKHFAGYGAAEGGLDYNTAEMSEQTLRNIYLPPFQAAVFSGVGTIMSAFNDLNGVPATSNVRLLAGILRGEWGFKGFVVSDWRSVEDLMTHGVAGSPQVAGFKAINAGVDMEMQGAIYMDYLEPLVESGQMPADLVDKAVKRILTAKFRLGLFENPYVNPELARQVLMKKAYVKHAREAAQKSIVLVKNDFDLLPLSGEVKKIAVIGPLADSRKAILGTWAADGRPEDAVSVAAGINERFSKNGEVYYVKGCDVTETDGSGIKEAVKAARASDAVIAVLGESAEMSGEAHSRSFIGLPGIQLELLKALKGTGKPIVLVLVNGRPMAIPWAAKNIPAILVTWQLGLQHGHAVADIISGDVIPGGRLPVTFPRSTGQEPMYYNHVNSGRPWKPDEQYVMKYIDTEPGPQWPFGFGLSYSTFSYNRLEISAEEIGVKDKLHVEVEVKNTGKKTADEVVQLYIRDMTSSITRPVRELKRFERVTLWPRQKKSVKFTIGPDDIGYYNSAGEFFVESGTYKLWVGSNSAEGMETEFRVVLVK